MSITAQPSPSNKPSRSVWNSDAMRRFRAHRTGMVSFLFIAAVVVLSLVGPFLAPDPDLATPANRLAAPSAEHWLGTDQLGRDIFARVLEGGRISLLVVALVSVLSLVFGLIVGLFAGYRGGMIDEFLSRVFDVLVTFPTLLLGLIVVVAVGPSIPSLVIAIAIADVPLYGRLFRAGAISVRNREYVQAVTAIGVPHPRIMLRHVLPNIFVPVLVIATGNMGRIALAEASLSYLGAGVQPPTASWGNMIADGQLYLQISPWFPLAPGLLLTAISIAFSFFGDALRDVFDLSETAGRVEPISDPDGVSQEKGDKP